MEHQIHKLSYGMSNAYIITGATPFMVDTGIYCTEETFVKDCRKCGIKPTDIELIIITHEHMDHFTQARWMKELTGAKVLCHYDAAEALIKGLKPYIVPRSMIGIKAYEDTILNPPPADAFDPRVVPDLLIEKEYSLEEYGIAGKIVPTPGHSKGSVSVILDSGDSFVGDIFLKDHFSDNLVIAFFADQPDKLKASVEYLLDVTKTFWSGHGGPYTKEQAQKAYEDDVAMHIPLQKREAQ